MVFSLDCYETQDTAFIRLEGKPISHMHVVDIRHMIDSPENVFADCINLADATLDFVRVNLDLLKNKNESKANNIELTEMSLAAYHRFLQTILKRDFQNASLFADANGDFSANPCENTQLKQVRNHIAWRYGKMLLERISKNCPFLHQILCGCHAPDIGLIVLADIPGFLGRGLAKATGRDASRIIIVPMPSDDVNFMISGWSFYYNAWFERAHLFLHNVSDIENDNEQRHHKTFLVNPCGSDRKAYKLRARPDRFLVVSNENGTRFYQSQNNIYYEIPSYPIILPS